jgi:hypothetical protein
MSDDAESNQNSLDLPKCMFRSGEKLPEDFPLFYWRIEQKNGGEKKLVADRLIKKFNDIDGNAFFEGDILIGPSAIVRNAQLPEAKGLVIAGDQFRWPAGKVKYLFVKDFLREKVELAVKHWEEHTPFKFSEIKQIDLTANTDYISFDDQGGCFSALGRRRGPQTISLGAGCGVGSAIHEIGHSLGLWHEQGRSDRDKFIKIVFEKIRPNALHNFDKHVDDGNDVGDYDFGSIMHYPSLAFSIDNEPTILTINGESIGQRNGLSKGDIETIKAIYPDLAWSTVTYSFVNGHCSCGHA